MPFQLANQYYANYYKDDSQAWEDSLCEKFQFLKYIIHPLLLVTMKIVDASIYKVEEIVEKVEHYEG